MDFDVKKIYMTMLSNKLKMSSGDSAGDVSSAKPLSTDDKIWWAKMLLKRLVNG